jgi:hypothetical protein
MSDWSTGMGARVMTSGRRPSTLRMMARRATGSGMAVSVGVDVEVGINVAVDVGSVKVGVAGRNGVTVREGGTTGVEYAGLTVGRQAASPSESRARMEKSRNRRKFIKIPKDSVLKLQKTAVH